MLKKLYDTEKKLIIIILILIASLSIMPIISYGKYELNRDIPYYGTDARAGETVEFSMFFEQKGGSPREYEMSDIQMVGEWSWNFDGTSFQTQPDTTTEIIFMITIPADAEDDERYNLQFGLTEGGGIFDGGYSYSSESFYVTVNNSLVHGMESHEGFSHHSGSGTGFFYTPLIFIPLSITIFCSLLLIMKWYQSWEKQSTHSKETHKCYQCGMQLVYIPEFNRWYCDNCWIYM